MPSSSFFPCSQSTFLVEPNYLSLFICYILDLYELIALFDQAFLFIHVCIYSDHTYNGYKFCKCQRSVFHWSQCALLIYSSSWGVSADLQHADLHHAWDCRYFDVGMVSNTTFFLMLKMPWQRNLVIPSHMLNINGQNEKYIFEKIIFFILNKTPYQSLTHLFKCWFKT